MRYHENNQDINFELFNAHEVVLSMTMPHTSDTVSM